MLSLLGSFSPFLLPLLLLLLQRCGVLTNYMQSHGPTDLFIRDISGVNINRLVFNNQRLGTPIWYFKATLWSSEKAQRMTSSVLLPLFLKILRIKYKDLLISASDQAKYDCIKQLPHSGEEVKWGSSLANHILQRPYIVIAMFHNWISQQPHIGWHLLMHVLSKATCMMWRKSRLSMEEINDGNILHLVWEKPSFTGEDNLYEHATEI